MKHMHIKLRSGAKMPVFKTEGAVGADLHAFLEKPYLLARGRRFYVPTGVFLAIPVGYEGHIRPRSSLAKDYGITTLSGTIDFDFRGELCAGLINLGEEDYIIEPGSRIAQIVFSPIVRFNFVLVDELDKTLRGEGGFGSTGI